MQSLRVSGDEVLADTGTVDRKAFRRLGPGFSLLSFALLLIICGGSPAGADPRALAAHVVHVRESRVYVAADSGALAIGDRLTFSDRKHVLATGRVAGLLDGAIASVLLESGTLTRVKKLADLRVTAEVAESAPPARLRVGIPAGARRSRLVACAACTLAVPPGWRSERTGATQWLAIREASAETLEVRLFRDADDEAIAWERGDLDAAVFWPEELSAYQRARFRASDLVVGVRSTDLDVKPDASASGDADQPGLATDPRRDCPILVRPSVRAAFDRLGANTVADLPACVR